MDNEKYFLVSPHNENDNPQRYFYWMRQNKGEDQWIQFVKGIWRPKHDNDIIKLCDSVEYTYLLDWTGTWLNRPDSSSGWLTREGRYYGCPSRYHDQLAGYVLGVKTVEAEEAGWVRVRDSQQYDSEKRLSAEQMNWLSGNGYKIYD